MWLITYSHNNSFQFVQCQTIDGLAYELKQIESCNGLIEVERIKQSELNAMRISGYKVSAIRKSTFETRKGA